MSSSLPITFRAFGNDELNTPVVPLDKTVSSLQADELLVKVAFASINPMDPKLQQNNKFKLPMPMILGFDFSGTVVSAGGEATGTADPSIQVGSEIFGFTFTGQCYAEYVVAKRGHVALRGEIPAAEASTYGIAYISAWEPVELVAGLSKRQGQWIYIAGAAGGVGHFAAQLAKAAGLKVIGSASKPESLALLRSLGVDHIIDYSKQNVVKEVLSITGGKGADLVFDPTYKAESMTQSGGTVASGGTWLRLGAHDDSDTEACAIARERGATATYGDFGRYIFHPVYVAQLNTIRQALAEVVRLYQEGKVRAHVSKVVPFDAKALQQALDDNLHGKHNWGKATVKIAD
jgi:NADPH:quinone reductase-like Zn-dependent oxidoreductase